MQKKVLVIDDDPDILQALQYALKDAGYQVQVNTNVNYTQIVKDCPKVIILDVFLSGRDGRDICKALKSVDTTKNIYIIMVSAQPDIAASTKQAGADEFIAKPFEIDELLTTIENVRTTDSATLHSWHPAQ